MTGAANPGTAAAGPGAATRSAEEIGRTSRGVRAIPDLTDAVIVEQPPSASATLDNGLAVLAVRKAGTPLVEARLRVPFGGRVPAPTHAARAEMLAATVLLGTADRTREDVDAVLAAVGGHADASVDPQRLLFSGSVLSSGLDVLLAILAEALTGAAYRASDVAIEQVRLQEHLQISLSQPATAARRHLQRRRFGRHPAAWEMPEPDDIASVTTNALRSMHRRQVVPSGATLILVGDLVPEQAIEAVAAAFHGWRSTLSAVELGTPPAFGAKPLAVFDNAGAVQSQVRLSAPAVGREDPSYPAQQVANLVYSGYFSSRLVENIREDKGFTYSASSTTQFWPGRSAVTVTFDTTTESTAAAVWEALYELGRLSLSPPTPAEVESAKNYALGTLAASLATQSGYAGMMSTLAGFGLGAEWLARYRSRIAQITPEEVLEVASAVFAPTAFLGVVVGDVSRFGPALAAVWPSELP